KSIISSMDSDIITAYTKNLKNANIKIMTEANVIKIDKNIVYYMDKLMDHSSDVEKLKSEASVLQAEINELRLKNAGLQDDNDILQVTRNTLSQCLQEIRWEQGRREVELSSLTKSNKQLQEKLAQLEADLALVRDKDEKERARL
ncbi:MAG: hypothetical protein Q8830_02920, partial [Candidatus Phytoplasma australasiaticum]|nr:hypothetical protein [Candidatus Phytoplasma australasiaticum]